MGVGLSYIPGEIGARIVEMMPIGTPLAVTTTIPPELRRASASAA
jgi:hypothetical protein